MDNPIPSLHGSRYYYQEAFRYYYPFGNTPARDFLEYAQSNVVKPSVLVLGCGDIRSCLLTIWKNFDPCFEHRFDGVHFVLNDRSAAVLARNIIFLYLCLKMPKSNPSRQKFLCAMWSIWFCHELLPDHESVLRNALKALLDFSVDDHQWSIPANPLHSIVHYFSPATLKEIRGFWSMWYNKKGKLSQSVGSMTAARQETISRIPNNVINKIKVGFLDLIGTLGFDLFQGKSDAIQKEYIAYLESGSIHAETLFDAPQEPSTERSVNVTMLEKRDKYNVHYGSCAFRCFQHTFVCNTEKMLSTGMYVTDSVRRVKIGPNAFQRFPLLANSFQQFSAWVSATADSLQTQHPMITFTFNSMDVFQFGLSWEIERSKKFDLIFASNVIDSVAPPAFILAAVKLLKKTGYFLSPTMLYTAVAPTPEEYIQACFGFSPRLLPIICGIRCINHEGRGCTSLVSPAHICIDSADIEESFSTMRERILIWEKTDMYPLRFKSLSACSDISLALSQSFYTCCTPLLIGRRGSAVLNCLCTDTAMKVLQTFAARLNTDLTRLHTFWSQLCSNLKELETLSSYLASIQTQAVVNGLHLHLLVDNLTCPTCTGLPISSYLGQFCLDVPLECILQNTPIFVVYLHKKSCFAIGDIQSVTENYHIIDCLVGISHSHKMKISFLAPLSLVEDGYNLTLVQYIQAVTVLGQCNLPSIILQGKLRKYQVNSTFDLPSYNFLQSWDPKPSQLGTVVGHIGNEVNCESVLSLFVEDEPALLSAKLHVSQVSPTEIEILCLQRSLVIKYPYPVSYDKLVVQRSKKEKSLTIKAKREPHHYENEGQLFHVNPDDHFSLPPIEASSDKREFFIQMQYSLKEIDILSTDPDASTSPLLKVKRCISLLFTWNEDFFFQLELPGRQQVGLIEVVNRVIDVNRRVPAIDLKFCFLDTIDKDASSVVTQQLFLKSCQESFDVVELFIYKEAYNLLKKIFINFSSHTLQSSNKSLSAKPSLLSKCKIENHFKRAIVYPLYPDPDRVAKAMKCSYCNNRLSDATVCSGCQNVSYCSKLCQAHHWGEHRLQCSRSTDQAEKSRENAKMTSTPEPSVLVKQPNDRSHMEESCSYCLKRSQSLKSCSKCRNALYCGQDCQKNHWKAHKLVCVSTVPASESKTSLRCSNCKKVTDTLKKCTRCETIYYCCKHCQINHWSEHKLKCNSSNKTDNLNPPDPSPQRTTKVVSDNQDKLGQPSAHKANNTIEQSLNRCSYCKKLTKTLRCTRCHKTSYCGQECQKKHWKEHKEICKAKN